MPAPHTSSHYLDTAHSVSDADSAAEEGYDSEAHEERKSKTPHTTDRMSIFGSGSYKPRKQVRRSQPSEDGEGSRASKRRKLSGDGEDDAERIPDGDSPEEDVSGDESREGYSDGGEASGPSVEDSEVEIRDDDISDIQDEPSQPAQRSTTKSRHPHKQAKNEEPAASASASVSEDEAGLPLTLPQTLKHPSTTPHNLTTHPRKTPTTNPPKHKPGILYLPTPPPFLKPTTLRTLLQPYTKHGISRIFLSPEPHAARLARLKGGGNRKKSFVEGWVECVSKRDAKRVVEVLNGRTMGEIGRFVGRYAGSSAAGKGGGSASGKSLGKGAKKGSRWRDDVWSLRYLRGFKWGDLVGERRDEEAERGARMDAERRAQRREVEAYVRSVEKSKVQRTRMKREKEGRSGGKVAGGSSEAVVGRGVGGRSGTVHAIAEEEGGRSRQKEAVKKRAGERISSTRAGGSSEQDRDEDLKRVLGKIF